MELISNQGQVVPIVPRPPEFAPEWALPFEVSRDHSGYAAYNFDLTTYAREKVRLKNESDPVNPGNVTYYVRSGGSNANDGLSEATAFATVAKALSMPDVGVILIKAGVLASYGTFQSIPRSVAIIGYGGEVVIAPYDVLFWSAAGTAYPNTYRATKGAVEAVYDAKNTEIVGGEAYSVKYVKRGSIAEVEANPGSYYADTVTNTVYVRTIDGRKPDSRIQVFMNMYGGAVSGDRVLYMENLTFEGGKVCFQAQAYSTSAVPEVYAKNCKFRYSTSDNCFNSKGAVTILQDCVAERSFRDGFNYHYVAGTGGAPHALSYGIELGCVGRHNGVGTGVNTNNGTTCHDGGRMLHMNGDYYGNEGPNLAHVNNSHSWVLGTKSHECAASTMAAQSINYYNDGVMYLESCLSWGSVTDLMVESLPGQTVAPSIAMKEVYTQFTFVARKQAGAVVEPRVYMY